MQEERKDPVVPNENLWALLCYIPFFNAILCPLIAVRMVESRLCRFHSKQGLLLFGTWIALMFIAPIFPLFGVILWTFLILAHFLGMYFAWIGNFFRLPIIANLGDRIAEYAIFKFLTGKLPVENFPNKNDNV